MLKGMGVGAIVKLVLAVMVASLFVSMTTIGSLGQALQQSFDNINQVTDYTTEVEDEKTFSDLAMFVRDRATGCEVVEARNEGENPDGDGDGSEGYPGLSEVQRLGQKPTCVGGSSTVLRAKGPIDAATPDIIENKEDNVMAGIYSREKFEIEEPVRFREGRDEFWLDRNLIGVSGKDYDVHIDKSGRESESNPQNRYIGSGNNYVVFFQNDTIAEERSSKLIENHNLAEDKDRWEDSRGFSDRVWYYGYNEYLSLDFIFNENKDYEFEFQLCPGDEGYIQLNRGVPYGSGQPMGEDAVRNYYPRIVIEETERKGCGEVNLGREDMIPNTATTKGQVLSITTKTGIGKSYPNLYCTYPNPPGVDCPYTDMFNLHDVKEDGYERELTWGGSMRVDPKRDSCYINVLDTSRVSRDAEGEITVMQGYHFERDADSFPHEDESLVPSVESESRWIVDADSAYSAFIENGFDGRSTKHSTPILYSYLGDKRFELYGDLLCAQDGEWSSWTMCDEDGKTVEAVGREWKCDGESGSWEQEDPDAEFESAAETITMDWDESTPKARDWLGTEPDSFRINSSKTRYDISMTWEQALPPNWEEFSVTLTPHKQGHLRIGGNGLNDDPYFYFGGEGVVGDNNKLYAHPPDSDDFDSTYAEISTYETDTSYTLTIDRKNNLLSVEESGSTIWEESVSSFIFPQIRLYQGSGSNNWEDTEATIENIEVIYPQPIEGNEDQNGDSEQDGQEEDISPKLYDQFDLKNTDEYNYASYDSPQIEFKLKDGNPESMPKSDNFLFNYDSFDKCTLTIKDGDNVDYRGQYDMGELVRMDGEFDRPDDILVKNGITWNDLDLNFDGEIKPGTPWAGSLRPENETEWQNVLYGDLLCGEDSEGAANRDGSWMLCHRNADIKTNEVRGTTYECNPETGEWQTTNIDTMENKQAYGAHSNTWIGDTIDINVSSGGSAWPKVNNFRLRDLKGERENQAEGCYIDYNAFNENGNSFDNIVTGVHSKGTLIEKWGQIPDPENKDEEQGIWEIKMSDVELNLLEDVYTDSNAGGELRLRNETAWRNRLYGEMMCAESQHHGGRDVWHLCAPGLEETMKGVETEVDGTNYTCNTETGEWENE